MPEPDGSLQHRLPQASDLRRLAERCRERAKPPARSYRMLGLGSASTADSRAELLFEVAAHLGDWADRLETFAENDSTESPSAIIPPVAEASLTSTPRTSRPEDPLTALLEGVGPDAAGLRQSLERLPEARGAGYWHEALMELYVETWGDLGARWRAGDPPAFGRFTDAVAELLRNELQFEIFAPVAVHDVREGWLIATPGCRPMTGLVRKLHRPGLVDAAGHMRIPAIAEVE
jgi:hypothetical protein